ncbi:MULTISPECIES: hypothetical protein [Streptomyces]|uniref:hypothetical protein n=1 Tax=Streptomyces TaxID=1883 RepID=UPI0007CD518F|nr:hypothetical protein A4V12_01715 [Streptomyces noursei]
MDAHRLVRTGVVAAAGAAVLLALAGCGGGPGGAAPRPAGGATPSPAATPAAPPSPSSSPYASAPPAAAGPADGSWVGLTGGKPVSVTVKKGHALVLAEAHVCQGTARGTAPVALTLTCDDGYTARTEGTASTERGKLVVTWADGTKDTLTKATAS